MKENESPFYGNNQHTNIERRAKARLCCQIPFDFKAKRADRRTRTVEWINRLAFRHPGGNGDFTAGLPTGIVNGTGLTSSFE